MKICPKCHNENEAPDNFCGLCGFKFEAFGMGPGYTQKDMKAADIQINLGVVYYRMGKLDEALKTVEKVLEHDPGNLQALGLKDLVEKALADGENEEIID